ncbi:MAG: sugar phosphate isomerase/epimerase [Thermoguttaceae bacterium]|nr:sugar phosphate isomerase/epimerase [Thermoguttaceae bacterium]
MKRIMFFVVALVACAATVYAQDDAARLKVGTNDVFKGPVGLQLYSLRDVFGQDLEKGFNTAEGLGFGYVELAGRYNLEIDEMVAKLKEHHLTPIAGHWDYNLFKNDPESVAKEVKALGLKYAGVAWIPHDGDFDEDDVNAAAEVFNNAGKVLAKYGIGFYYHNHGYEFLPAGDGKTMFDLLVERTDPKYVSFQMDILWTIFPGQDAAALLRKYPDRWLLIYLKDLKKGVEGNNSGGTSVENDVTLGSGQVPYAEVLKAAQEVGVKYYFIEDESPRAVEQIPNSLKFLESVKW